MNQMTRQEILDAILPLNGPENAARRLQWLIRLGYQMTISARAGYPTVDNKIEHLVAFNELQHQLYNQMLHCQTNDEWHKVEELLENLRKYADATGVTGDFGWAALTSIRIADSSLSMGQTGEKSPYHSLSCDFRVARCSATEAL